MLDIVFLLASPALVAVVVMLLRRFQPRSWWQPRLSDGQVALVGALPFILIGYGRELVQHGAPATLVPLLSGLAWAAVVVTASLILGRSKHL